MLIFPKHVEFEEWKEKKEEDSVCSFVKATGAKEGHQVQYCQCNRGGTYRQNKMKTGKRRMNIIVTCIIQHNLILEL